MLADFVVSGFRVEGVSQCNGCHHTIVDVFRRLTFISGKLTKRGVLIFNI